MFRIISTDAPVLFSCRYFLKIMNFSDHFRQCFEITFMLGNKNHKLDDLKSSVMESALINVAGLSSFKDTFFRSFYGIFRTFYQ